MIERRVVSEKVSAVYSEEQVIYLMRTALRNAASFDDTDDEMEQLLCLVDDHDEDYGGVRRQVSEQDYTIKVFRRPAGWRIAIEANSSSMSGDATTRIDGLADVLKDIGGVIETDDEAMIAASESPLAEPEPWRAKRGKYIHESGCGAGPDEPCTCGHPYPMLKEGER